MSDVQETAPSSTADIAGDVLESLEAAETPSETTTETPAATVSPAAPVVEAKTETPAVVQPALSEAEKLLHDAGYTQPRRDDGRENRIPHSKVVKIIENGINQGKGHFGEKFKAVETERNTYKADLDEMYADVRGDPRAFLEKLAQHDPRYKTLLEPAAPATVEPQAAPLADMPAPDITLQDGSRTYSIDGLKKLLEWNTGHVKAQLMPELDAKLKPWQEREKAEHARVEAEKAAGAVRERTQSQIAEAQTWPSFKDHEADILKALQEDSTKAHAEKRRPTLSLEGAYRQVVMAKLSADRNKMREEILKETSHAAKASPAVPRAGQEVPRAPGRTTTADVAARVLSRLEGAS